MWRLGLQECFRNHQKLSEVLCCDCRRKCNRPAHVPRRGNSDRIRRNLDRRHKRAGILCLPV